MHKLSTYTELLLKWNQSVNLIARSTHENIWQRHINDSLQLSQYMQASSSILDIGSGGGLPAVVLSILGHKVTCVESDQKKALFLEHMNHQLALDMVIKNIRIEQLDDTDAYDLITARACAPLTQLLEWSYPHAKENAFCLFLKGENWRNEIVAAQEQWAFNHDDYPSVTHDAARIIKITSLVAS